MRRVGIDLGVKAPHAALIVEDGIPMGRPFKVTHDQEGFERLIDRATAGIEGPVEFVLEPTGNAWQVPAAWLRARGQRVLVTTGQKVSDLRKVFRKHTKTDAVDGYAAARIPDLDARATVTAAAPRPEQISLTRAGKQRARLQRSATKQKQRIAAVLELANPPLVKELGRRVLSQALRRMLREHLDPFKIRKAGLQALEALLTQDGRSGAVFVDLVWSACEAVCKFYGALYRCGELPFRYEDLHQELLTELDCLEWHERRIAELDKRIAELYVTLDPARTLEQLPGVGTTIASTVEALTGDVRRFRSAQAFVSFTGLCPRKSESGKRKKLGLPITKGGPRLLKQYLYLAADTARRNDVEFAAKYAELTARGKHHFVAVVALANMLARRIYSLLCRRADGEAHYDHRDTEGRTISRQRAREHVQQNYPSKRQQQQRKRDLARSPATRSAGGTGEASTPEDSGQHNGSTIRSSSAPPEEPHAIDPRACVEELRAHWEMTRPCGERGKTIPRLPDQESPRGKLKT